MTDLAVLQAQHRRGHGPSGMCGGMDKCVSAKYLEIIARQQEQIAELLRWKQQREIDDYEELVEAAKQRRARQ